MKKRKVELPTIEQCKKDMERCGWRVDRLKTGGYIGRRIKQVTHGPNTLFWTLRELRDAYRVGW